ncbi:hypothetical protein CGLO_09231 [Colletotrichum gloeosporioides Cg-14]|uniref:Uncharacterized protein n=1 Tax=Colletotrichum gloeosporioides (strain Cg-14) TaxID=1237896 RepID=T0KGK5_COLGC|nr:hypothetical protein CGLO_09231 [Colletotrichum gloeosporioides Cg-14]
MGSFANLNSQTPNATRMKTPRTRGRSDLKDFHSYMTPPVEIPNRKLVEPAVKRKLPSQSNRQSLPAMSPGILACFRKKKIMTTPTAMMGRLIQKIHAHVTFCAKPAPISGPVTVPTDQTAESSENHCPRT